MIMTVFEMVDYGEARGTITSGDGRKGVVIGRIDSGKLTFGSAITLSGNEYATVGQDWLRFLLQPLLHGPDKFESFYFGGYRRFGQRLAYLRLEWEGGHTASISLDTVTITLISDSVPISAGRFNALNEVLQTVKKVYQNV